MSAFSTPCLLKSPLYNDGRVNFVFASPIIVSLFPLPGLYKTIDRYRLVITTGSSSPSSTTRQSRSFHIVLRALWAIFLLCNKNQNTTLNQMRKLITRPFSAVQCTIVQCLAVKCAAVWYSGAPQTVVKESWEQLTAMW